MDSFVDPVDLVNAGISLAHGKYGEAGLSLICVVPYLGMIPAVGKIGMKAPRMVKAVPYTDELIEFCGKWFKCFVAGTPTHVPGEESTQHPDDASLWGGGIVLVGAFGLLATDQLDRRRKRKQKAAAGMGDGQPGEWFADDEVDPDGDDLGQSHQLSTTTPDSDLYDVLAASQIAAVRTMRCDDSNAVTPVAEMENRGLGRGRTATETTGAT